MTPRRGARRDQGFALIGSYLLLSALLVYSNAVTLGTLQQQQATDRLAERLQAQNLASTSLEEFRENLHVFLTSYVYQVWNQGDAIKAMQWLDALGRGAESPPLPTSDLNADGMVSYQDVVQNGATGNNAKLKPKLTLPARTKMQFANAWVIPGGVRNSDTANPPDPLAPRLVTVEAEAQVGSTVKRVRATYSIALGMSEIFRYAYFVNNYGWFDIQGNSIIAIRGEARANGDFTFTGPMSNTYLDGDIYAARNPELINPKTKQPALGKITGDPNQAPDQGNYWSLTGGEFSGYNMSRPTLRLTFPGQPPIGGKEKVLPSGAGWHSDSPDQKRYEAQPIQAIPYLGDLKIYKTLATQKRSTLTYRDAATGKTKSVAAVYAGPDGMSGTADDTTPLVLIGTGANPIVLNGPVVVPGDVIIKGVVSGQGTIYAGRNVHVVGETKYKQPPQWRRLERNKITGRVARRGYGAYPSYGSEANLGTVCKNGAYYTPGAALPSGCM